MRTKIFSAIKVSTLALVLSFGLSFVYAWTAPTVTAPNGNVSAPINTSSTAQTKAGAFTVGSLITSGSATVGSLNAGSGSISTTGNISATSFSGGGAGLTGTAAGLTAGALSVAAPSFASTYSNAASFSADVLGGNKFYVFGYDDDHSLRFGFGTTPSNAGANVKMVMKSTGNVGIGDPEPADTLSVMGSVGVTGNITSLATTTTNGLKVANSTAGVGKVLTSDASGNASWQAPAGSVTSQITTYSTATTTTLTVPAGLTSMRVVLAGGGGGGGTDTTRSGAGGGGGGGQIKTAIFNNLTPLATYTLTVGAGGGGGSYVDYPYSDPGQNAGDGGVTRISGLAGATAAGGGKGNNPFNTGGLGYGGATGGGTSNGDRATLVGTAYTAGKGGGCASYGIGGAGGANGVNTGTGNGHNATGNCAGGGGGGSNSRPSSGGRGAPGMAVVRFFAPAGAATQSEYMTLLDALQRQGIATQ